VYPILISVKQTNMNRNEKDERIDNAII
jgi:hypothetical protein